MTGFSEERAIWLSRNVLPHEPALRAWLRRFHVDGLEVDDVIQETYAILATRDVSAIRNPKTYLFQAARSVVLMYLRRSRVVSIISVENIERFAGAAEDPSPELQVSDRQELQRLAEAIAALPPIDRQALTLRLIEGLTQAEIGSRMGISEGAAQKRIAKSIQLLMGLLGRGGKHASGASNRKDQDRAEPVGTPRDERGN